ncbi:hypothetical protein OSTOST_19543 [Ostertagia ostertagi]
MGRIVTVDAKEFFSVVSIRYGKVCFVKSKLLAMIEEHEMRERMRELEERLATLEDKSVAKSSKRKVDAMIEKDEIIRFNYGEFFTHARQRGLTIKRSKLLKMMGEYEPRDKIRELEERLTSLEKTETIRRLKKELAILKKKLASTDSSSDEDEPKVKKPKKEIKSEDEEE